MSNYSNTCLSCGHVGIRDQFCAETSKCWARKTAKWHRNTDPTAQVPVDGCDCPTCLYERATAEYKRAIIEEFLASQTQRV